MRVSARTRVFALLGDPIGHSLSPRIQNAAFQAAGLDAIYIALQPTAETLAGTMTALVRGGGGGNVTVPFKEVAARVAGIRSERVDRLGAANVFGSIDGALQLGNSDVDGILAALDALGSTSRSWLVLGTGGSARAVVGAAAERGASLAIRSRSKERGGAFADWAASLGVTSADPAECGSVINATPLGLAEDDPYPLNPAEIAPASAVLDLTYTVTGTTRWVRECRARKLEATDGREVLLAQGAAAWSCWFPKQAPPLEVMRAALHGRLG